MQFATRKCSGQAVDSYRVVVQFATRKCSGQAVDSQEGFDNFAAFATAAQVADRYNRSSSAAIKQFSLASIKAVRRARSLSQPNLVSHDAS